MSRSLFVLLCAVCACISVQAASPLALAGKPVKFYAPSEYGSDAQVWSISPGEGDDVYFATNEGVVLYDGVRWERYVTPSECIMRSVFHDAESRLTFSGGVNEFGYWNHDDYGNLVYTRLFENAPGAPTQEFWRVARVAGSNLVYFGSPIAVMAYDMTAGKVTTLQADAGKRFGHLFLVDNHVYTQHGGTLYRLNGLKKEPVTDTLDNFRVTFMTSTRDGGLRLYSSEKGSITLARDGSIVSSAPYKGDIRVTSMTRHGDNLLVGTGNSGFFTMDSDGNLLSTVGPTMGLRNSVLSVGVSNSGDIWLGLNGGIMAIEQSAHAESYLFDPEEAVGYIYCALNHDDRLYAGTNKGLYVINDRGGQPSFDPVPGIKGQVWNLYDTGREVIVAHDKGLFGLSGNTLREIKRGGVYTLLPVPARQGYYVSGNYDGLSLYHRDRDGRLQFVQNIAGHNDLVQNCAFDRVGNLWVAQSRKEFKRLHFDGTLSRVIEGESYAVPSDEASRGFMVKTAADLLFLDGRGDVFKYNDLDNTLTRDDYYSTLLAPVNRAMLRMQSFGDTFWLVDDEGVCLLMKDYNRVSVHSGLFSRMKDRFITKGFRKVMQLQDSLFAMGLENGLGFIDLTALSHQPVEMPVPRLRRAEVMGAGGNSFLSLAGGVLRVPPHTGLMRLWLTSLNRDHRVEYRLAGRGEEWETSTTGYIDLSYLSPGHVTLEMRGSDGFGGYSEVATVEIDVAAPWWATWWAFVGYFLMMVAAALVTRHIFRLKTRRKEELIRLDEERKRREEMDRFRLDALQEELGNKNSKLMSITMLGVQNNTFLKKIKEDIQRLEEAEPPETTRPHLKRLVKAIDNQLNDQSGWENFAEHFNNTTNGFFDRLTKQHPRLTNSDLRLCAYTRMNLSTKEIASLMNVSASSVEMARYRLRKKLDLEPTVTLQHYLLDI